jgi:signal transduction histidine kinase
MFSSLQTRLLLTVGLLAVAAVAAVALAARQGARQEFLRFRDIERRSASAKGAERSADVARAIEGRCCERGVLDAAAAAMLGPTLAALVVDPLSGGLVASAGVPARDLSDVTTARTGDLVTIEATRRSGRVINRLALKLRQAPMPITLTDGRRAHLYVLPFPSEEQDREAAAVLGSLDRRLLVATMAVAVLALGLTWMLARRTVQPIAALRAATRDLGRGDLARRVDASGVDEVAELARAFNAMAAELERQQTIRRGLMHDVAHELRTPLTALRCRVETIVDGLADDPARALADVQQEVLHLGRLVDDLQELALAEARELRLDLTDVSVIATVDSAVRAAGLEPDVRVRIDVGRHLAVRADAVRLRQILLNLLTNADRHTPAGGTILVSARPDNENVRVQVENTGSTLEAEQLARIFDRFYRTDPSRQRGAGGTGLGLAIVRHLVEAQGGSVHARSGVSSVTVGFHLHRVPDCISGEIR